MRASIAKVSHEKGVKNKVERSALGLWAIGIYAMIKRSWGNIIGNCKIHWPTNSEFWWMQKENKSFHSKNLMETYRRRRKSMIQRMRNSWCLV